MGNPETSPEDFSNIGPNILLALWGSGKGSSPEWRQLADRILIWVYERGKIMFSSPHVILNLEPSGTS